MLDKMIIRRAFTLYIANVKVNIYQSIFVVKLILVFRACLLGYLHFRLCVQFRRHKLITRRTHFAEYS